MPFEDDTKLRTEECHTFSKNTSQVLEDEAQLASLSGFHDFEPNLEFDDSDFLLPHDVVISDSRRVSSDLHISDEDFNEDWINVIEHEDEEEKTLVLLKESHSQQNSIKKSSSLFCIEDLGFTPLQCVETTKESNKVAPPSERSVHMYDGTVDEDFETALSLSNDRENQGLQICNTGVTNSHSSPNIGNTASQNQNSQNLESVFRHLSDLKIVDVVGDDLSSGSKIIVISACKIPNSSRFCFENFFRYLLHVFDTYVSMDYTVVYFHHGLKYRPPLRYLISMYRTLDRRYKKNLKKLYIIHPTSFLKAVFNVFKPIISAKFGRKVQYFNHLGELNHHIDLNLLPIPTSVIQYDKKSVIINVIADRISKNERKMNTSPNFRKNECLQEIADFPIFSDLQQYGASLSWINEHHDIHLKLIQESLNTKKSSIWEMCMYTEAAESTIPPLVITLVQFLSQKHCLDMEGLFRRSTNAAVLQDLQNKINKGGALSVCLEFDATCPTDVHVSAVLLKSFFRHLSDQPLLTYDLFQPILSFGAIGKDERLIYVKNMLSKLPDQNLALLKYLVKFFNLVVDHACVNRMTSSNIAVVFGPNLIWSQTEKMSLEHISPINAFIQYIIDHNMIIF